MSFGWEANTISHPFHHLLEAEVLTPSARTTSWLAAFCRLHGSFAGSLAEVGHHKNKRRFWLNK